MENRYTLPVSTTSMDGLAGETIATYVYDYGHAPISFETTTLANGKMFLMQSIFMTKM